ncbi:33346_t:CDS:2 [Gigaspora margarita]|uniref:33346_t:CDS:1 n=1 Tax=Gigaspora margarita TaxID=4874 RepID=A0ABN7VRE9_GIGMA|nr:33346_t:CDS:2 [Gigaspora margarita]
MSQSPINIDNNFENDEFEVDPVIESSNSQNMEVDTIDESSSSQDIENGFKDINSFEDIEDQPNPKKANKSLPIAYEYYRFNKTTKQFKCKFCPNKYKKPKDSSTSTLRTHLRNVHNFNFEKLEIKKNKNIVKYDHPFTIVEEDEFKDIIDYITEGPDQEENLLKQDNNIDSITAIKKLRKIILFARSTPQRKEKFMKYNSSKLELIMDIKTR